MKVTSQRRSAPRLVVHVNVHVKPGSVEAFKAASMENAKNSVHEPGIARFDVIQQQDDPSRFVLVEVYRTAEDPARHKETAHYATWRDTVADMMAEPRNAAKYANNFPDESGWDMPQSVTASTGLDALTQCLEPFVSRLATPLTDGFCREGMRRAARSLRRVFRDGSDSEARRDMALTSLCGGLALANAKLGAVHGFAGPIGGMFDAPHGAVCAGLLPHVMEANVRALQERASDSPALARYEEVGKILTNDTGASVADGVAWVQSLVDELAVPSFADYGMRESDLADIVAKAMPSSSMKGNPITLTEAELTAVLADAL